MKKKDLIIIGAGPAGLSAAIYATRYLIDFEIIAGNPGGLLSEAYDVENYPGFKMIKGNELAKEMVEQVKALGKDIIVDNIQGVRKEDGTFYIKGNSEEYESKSVLLTIGTERKKLGIPGEKEFAGRGVSYCATCDGFFFKDKVVAVVGGGDAALGAADYLSDLAKKVYLVHRRDEYRADPHWQKRINLAGNIEEVLECTVEEILGGEKVEKLRMSQKGNCKFIEVDGVFIEIGETPQGALLDGLGVERDAEGFVKIDGTGATSLEGVWAAGDLTDGSNKFRQIVTAASEGAISAVEIYKYLKKHASR